MNYNIEESISNTKRFKHIFELNFVSDKLTKCRSDHKSVRMTIEKFSYGYAIGESINISPNATPEELLGYARLLQRVALSLAGYKGEEDDCESLAQAPDPKTSAPRT